MWRGEEGGGCGAVDLCERVVGWKDGWMDGWMEGNCIIMEHALMEMESGLPVQIQIDE